MRHIKFVLFTCLMITRSVFSQECSLDGMDKFITGQYKEAISSLTACIESHVSERGICHYYIGESYYNLGFEESQPSAAIALFKKSIEHLENSIVQSDLVTAFPELIPSAKYKIAWNHFRISELEDNPLESIQAANGYFMEMTQSTEDTYREVAWYMAGETYLRIAEWMNLQVFLAQYVNPGRAVQFTNSSLYALNGSWNAFQRVSGRASGNLRTYALLRAQDVLFIWAKLYAGISREIFNSNLNPDAKRFESPLKSAESILRQVNYRGVLNSSVGNSAFQNRLSLLVDYSEAVKFFNLFLISKSNADRAALDGMLDNLKFVGEKQILMGNRDQVRDLNTREFINLSDDRESHYFEASRYFPEANYWLGWCQFISGTKVDTSLFGRFIRDTESMKKDPRINVLREDATYRKYLTWFENNIASTTLLRLLKTDLEKFKPSTFVDAKKDTLLRMVRLALGESIGDVVPPGPRREAIAFELIRDIFTRATRSTGATRKAFLAPLESAFRIIGLSSDQTRFHTGFALFLTAEMEPNNRIASENYQAAARVFNDISINSPYYWESRYINARCHFDMNINLTTEKEKQETFQRAKPIFVDLINQKRSLRSVFYLGEIFFHEKNYWAADSCYRVVRHKGARFDEGKIFIKKLRDLKIDEGSNNDRTVLQNINVNLAEFPEILCKIDDDIISLERYGKAETVQQRYQNEANLLLSQFGLPKRSLYPSVQEVIGSRYKIRDFGDFNAEIQEKTIGVNSGLNIQVVVPDEIKRIVRVNIESERILPNDEGIYQITDIPLNQVLEIRIEFGNKYYPFVDKHRFSLPRIEDMTVVPFPRLKVKDKTVIEANVLGLSEVANRGFFLKSDPVAYNKNANMYKDLNNDSRLRDYTFSDQLNGFLVTNSQENHLLLYGQNQYLVGDGIFEFYANNGTDGLKSPEGITVDSEGRIYLTDWEKHKIFIFNSNRTLLRSFGQFGDNRNPADEVRLTLPSRIDIIEDDMGLIVQNQKFIREKLLAVTDWNGLHLISASGHFLGTLLSFPIDIEGSRIVKGSIYGLSVEGYLPDLTIYIYNQQTDKIFRINTQSASDG